MRLYTSTMSEVSMPAALERGVGSLIASVPSCQPGAWLRKLPHCALDNGAFVCWQKGYPFQDDVFLSTLARCYRIGLALDWIVIPDIVAAGRRSLEFSASWIRRGGALHTAPRLALAVQDGMEPSDVHQSSVFERICCVFVGGSLEWKWRTAPMWSSFAHAHGKTCHIGRCGTVEHLRAAQAAGADSCDSSSWVRNDSWHIVDEFRSQGRLFE